MVAIDPAFFFFVPVSSAAFITSSAFDFLFKLPLLWICCSRLFFIDGLQLRLGPPYQLIHHSSHFVLFVNCHSTFCPPPLFNTNTFTTYGFCFLTNETPDQTLTTLFATNFTMIFILTFTCEGGVCFLFY